MKVTLLKDYQAGTKFKLSDKQQREMLKGYFKSDINLLGMEVRFDSFLQVMNLDCILYGKIQ